MSFSRENELMGRWGKDHGRGEPLLSTRCQGDMSWAASAASRTASGSSRCRAASVTEPWVLGEPPAAGSRASEESGSQSRRTHASTPPGLPGRPRAFARPRTCISLTTRPPQCVRSAALMHHHGDRRGPSALTRDLPSCGHQPGSRPCCPFAQLALPAAESWSQPCWPRPRGRAHSSSAFAGALLP